MTTITILNLLPRATVTEKDLKATKEEAFTLWEKIKDLFRELSGKKETVLNMISRLRQAIKAITPNDDAIQATLPDDMIAMDHLGNDAIKLTELNNVFSLFNALKEAADDSVQHQFQYELMRGENGQAPYYRFSITNSNTNEPPLLSFTAPTYWHELDKLTVDNKKFIEHYNDIVKDYAQTRETLFKAQYGEDIKLEGNMGADHLMACSVFFLENNPEIQNMLSTFGLKDEKNCDAFHDEIAVDARFIDSEGLVTETGRLRQYTLTTIYSALSYITNSEASAGNGI